MRFGLSATLAKKISRRYAQALFDLAVERKIIEQVNTDVLLLSDTLQKSPDLLDFIKNPHNSDKIAETVLNEIFRNQIDPLTFDFLVLLIQKGRLIALNEILNAFIQLYHAYHRVTKIEIVSAFVLSREQVDSICQKLKARHHHEYFAVTTVDPTLIGGFQIRAGDEVIDFSMKTQLDNYRRQVINS